jgi:zinc finger CCHC domain-containing protein 8
MELAKVKKMVRAPSCLFSAVVHVASLLSQRPFELDVVNIQDQGQERWKRKYVYWIPALHLDGKEVAKGRWDAQTVNQALDVWESKQTAETAAESPGASTPPSNA